MKKQGSISVSELIFIILAVLTTAGIITYSLAKSGREVAPVIAYLSSTAPTSMATSTPPSTSGTIDDEVLMLDNTTSTAPVTTELPKAQTAANTTANAVPAPIVESTTDEEPTEEAPPIEEIININTANIAQLETLNGIGPVKAEAIIAYREEFGAFINIEEIMEVKGIAEKTFEKIRERICVE